MKLTVIIATAGRPQVLATTIAYLAHQSRLPDEIVIAATCDEDVGELSSPVPIRILCGPKGSAIQRNCALDYALPTADLITFFDDDFLPEVRYLEKVMDYFEANQDWAVICGNVIADGARGPGISFEEGLEFLRRPREEFGDGTDIADHVGAYGCNMSFRAAQVGARRFDPRLVLYGWQEDIDFSAQFKPQGRIVGINDLRGVHLGVKLGRTSGVRFGYSQMVNPTYLVAKGTVPLSFAADLMVRNLAANLLKSLRPEPWVDRRGRLKGNVLGLRDVLFGRVQPERVLAL